MPWFYVDDGFSDSKPVMDMPARHRLAACGRQRPVWRPVTRHCSNCLRHTETDRVPEQRLNGYTIPAYTVCTYCGHSYGFEETA